ncbi:MAG: peptidylprolyl isomerase FKBP-type [Gemmatimonadetes bacterium]|jgi:FKBP-type peptidyl-prolyl cis-trans isomerase|nr:peptidylprolyl isomerase FKBP-type [Gemmatimonadota bacterium]
MTAMSILSRLRRLRPRHAALAASLAGALALAAACGSTEPRSVPIEQTLFADTLHVTLSQFTRLPSGMYVKDVTVGTGADVAVGQTLSVRYVGNLANGRQFDANPAPKALFQFKLGAGQVIPGWDIGIQGMKVGGRRMLIIPPELAYGANSVGSIPAYSVLVFTVDVVSAS